jgi:hypothetical protein
MYNAEVSIGEGLDIRNSPDCNGEFLCRFENALKNSMCFTTDSPKEKKSHSPCTLSLI